VAAFLDHAGELARVDGVAGGEVADPEVHPLGTLRRSKEGQASTSSGALIGIPSRGR
jgi:hypothetical protein